jgi:hypothetical protein
MQASTAATINQLAEDEMESFWRWMDVEQDRICLVFFLLSMTWISWLMYILNNFVHRCLIYLLISAALPECNCWYLSYYIIMIKSVHIVISCCSVWWVLRGDKECGCTKREVGAAANRASSTVSSFGRLPISKSVLSI